MDEAEYRRRHALNEAYVNRATFLCSDACREKVGRATWHHHAWALLQYLADVIDADYYGEPRPPYPSTGFAHLNEDLARARDHLESTWSSN